MKDWGVSRQRYWGCPIPIVYDKEDNAIPVPKNMLPVKLPEKINLNTKGNPLNYQEKWKNVLIDGKNKNPLIKPSNIDKRANLNSIFFLKNP